MLSAHLESGAVFPGCAVSPKTTRETFMALNHDELIEKAEQSKEEWNRFYVTIQEILDRMDAPLVADLELPSGIEDEYYRDRKYSRRRYTRALVKITFKPFGTRPRWENGEHGFHTTIEFGVAGSFGTFFPQPEKSEAKSLIQTLGDLRTFVVFFGGAQKFLDAMLTASQKVARLDPKSK